MGSWREFPGEAPTDGEGGPDGVSPSRRVNGLIFLISPDGAVTEHLRILAEFATQVEDRDFMRRWQWAKDEHELKEALIRHEWFVTVELRDEGPTGGLDGRRIRELDLPSNTLVALVRRDGHAIFPRGAPACGAGIGSRSSAHRTRSRTCSTATRGPEAIRAHGAGPC